MSTAALFRLSGLALILAVITQVAGWLIHPAGEEIQHLQSAGHVPSHAVMILSWLLVVFGLFGVYLRQAERAGRLGLVSFVLVVASIAYHFYLLVFESVVAPQLADDEAARHLIEDGGPLVHGGAVLEVLTLPIFASFVLFGIATVRARRLPRWSGWLQIASLPALIVSAALIEAGPLGALGNYGGTMPVSFFYHVLFAGFGVAGYALWSESATMREVERRVATSRAAA